MEFQLLSLPILIPTLLGFISSLNTLLWLLNWTWTNFLRPPKDLKRCYGSWALVTGAADGIGRAISLELANRGLNLVLLDRDAPKLETTAKEILHERSHEVEVRTLVSDLCVDREDELVRKVREVIEGLDVGVVINNAGTTHRDALFFDEVESGVVETIVRVNVEAATWVTKAVVPVMLERRRGVVVNIGSGSASFLPSFLLFTVYAATKAYIHMFTRSISLEYKHHGIDIQCQAPLLVATRLSSMKKSSFWAPYPKTFAGASVDRIGYEVMCSPYWLHSLQWYVLDFVPTSVKNWLTLKIILDMRKRKQLKHSMKATHKQS